jgi:hypothetical protein
MGDQPLYDLIITAVPFYLLLCLCMIGRPSPAVTLLRWSRHAKLYLSLRKVPPRVNEASSRTNLRNSC